ncbi:glycosyltransferase [Herbiconiux sp. CPCC 205716]|uniref:D-inositol 3-phosphate glycosyltransferase n=1 Tax=Herbiconiux gentiana TaxID=2970912 RepID=A0ABT2GJN2_9MICO|nr:glycosyltransferase [Herbiconiux gentiana]MCS5714976.1 glycosyltransferase [Herbiconiux gentiana]
MGADTFSPDVNGSARFSEHLASGLASRGHDVHVVAPSAGRKHGTWKEVYDGNVITAHRLYSWRWYPHDWLRFALPWRIRQNSARIIDEVKPDVVHFQSHIVVGRGLSTEAEKRGIRIVGTNHFMPENMLAFTGIPKVLQNWAIGLAWAAARRSFARADAVTAPTRRAADYFEKETGLRDVYAISCGVDASLFTPAFGPRTENRVIFVGRVTGEKHLDVLLKAIQLLPDSLETKLDIVGGGDQLKNLQAMAQQLGIGDRVTFTGYVTEEEKQRLYTRATVFAMPSIAELQSIATMEAMASGLPVVAANAMALPHLVHDGENGYLFAPGDAQELADRLERVLTLPQGELDRFKNESLSIVAAHDIQRTLTTFEHIYRGEPVPEQAHPVSSTPPA